MNGERRLQLCIIVLLALTIVISAYLVYLEQYEDRWLKSENDRLRSEVQSLRRENEVLKGNVTSLQSKVEELINRELSVNVSQAYEGDPRIKIVSCEVKKGLLTSWIEVKVKNVGDKPLSIVYVFLVIEGATDLLGYKYYAAAYNLWMGEEATVKLGNPEKPFKVIAIAPP